MSKQEYPKWIYHADSRARLVADVDAHTAAKKDGFTFEEPQTPAAVEAEPVVEHQAKKPGRPKKAAHA